MLMNKSVCVHRLFSTDKESETKECSSRGGPLKRFYLNWLIANLWRCMCNTSLKIPSCTLLAPNYRHGSSKQETGNQHYLCHVRVVVVATNSSGFCHPLLKGDSSSLPVCLRVRLRLSSLSMQSGAGESGGFQHKVGGISGFIVGW